MQYDQPTPKAYLTHLDDDWRKATLVELRQLITSAVPEADEFIQYKMLAYGKSDNTLFGLNAQKNYVSLYVGDIKKIDPDGHWLTGLNHGKGCIRFSKSIKIPETRISEFITEAARLWRDGRDLSC